MFTGTTAEYRKAMGQAKEYGAQINDLLNKIEALGVGTVRTQGPFKLAGPDFTIRRHGDRWIYTA